MDKPITPREREVLAAIGEHLSNAQIARRLRLSVRTVESHVASLLRKAGVAERVASLVDRSSVCRPAGRCHPW